MGSINLYNGISNEHSEIKANGKLKDILPEFDFSKAVILKGGESITSDYEVTENDIIFLRYVPHSLTAVALTVITTGFVIAAGVVMAEGITAYVDQVTKDAQEKAQRDAQNLAQQIQQLPFIKGANNKSALGNAVQFIMGSVYNTPYKITDGFYTIANGDLSKNEYGYKQYYNLILSCGFGNQKITKVMCGDTSLLQDDDGINSGIHDFDSSSLFYDTENKIELRQKGEDFTTSAFKQKVICTSDGSEIKHDYGEDAEPLIRTLSDYTQKVEVCIQFNGLRQYDSENSAWTERQATINVYWTNAENPTDDDWKLFYFANMNQNTISLNSNKTLRFVATKTFTAAESYGKTIKIKLIKETPALESNSNEDCYLSYYQSYCYDNAKSSASSLVACAPLEDELKNQETRIALRMIANDNTKDQLEEFHVLCCGLARTWDGSSWSTEKTATRNPAAWILEILTSDAHKHSKYSDDEIDLDSLGALYDYCNTNSFYTDGILTAGIKKRDLISDILSTVNTDMVINEDGLLEFVTDQKESTPVALLNSENISSITYAKDLTRKPDGLKVTFTNRESWQTDTFYAMLDGEERTQDDTLTEINLNYVTDYNHAYKVAQRKMRQQVLQPREISVDVGREGDYYPLYSTVMLQYTTFRQGLNSSTIAELITGDDGITGIVLSDAVIIESDKNYGVIIQAQSDAGKKHYYKKVSGALGKTRSLVFDEAISVSGIVPQASNIVSFGLLDEDGKFSSITNTMKITGITANDNGYTLKLKDYNESIYEYGTIPEYKSNITVPPKAAKTIPSIQKVESIKGEKGDVGASAFNYLGIISSAGDVPVSNNGDFFLCGSDFTKQELLYTSKGILIVDGKKLRITHPYAKGYIYYSDENGNWIKEENKNNYKYIIALNDLIDTESTLSPNMTGVVQAAEPHNLGTSDSDPEDAEYGDYYSYSGDDTDDRKSGYIYQMNKDGDWEVVEPNSSNYKIYMNALPDILNAKKENITTDIFAQIFADAICSNSAFINSLAAKVITLQSGGSIQSDGFVSGSKGFQITSSGDAEFNSGYFRGGLGQTFGVDDDGNLQFFSRSLNIVLDLTGEDRIYFYKPVAVFVVTSYTTYYGNEYRRINYQPLAISEDYSITKTTLEKTIGEKPLIITYYEDVLTPAYTGSSSTLLTHSFRTISLSI